MPAYLLLLVLYLLLLLLLAAVCWPACCCCLLLLAAACCICVDSRHLSRHPGLTWLRYMALRLHGSLSLSVSLPPSFSPLSCVCVCVPVCGVRCACASFYVYPQIDLAALYEGLTWLRVPLADCISTPRARLAGLANKQSKDSCLRVAETISRRPREMVDGPV